MEWIPTSERLPTEKDAGRWDVVNVLPGNPNFTGLVGVPVTVRVELVGRDYFTHWMRIPDPPEQEPKG